MSSHRDTGRVPVRAVLSLGIVLGFGATSTMAYWADEAVMTSGSFTGGAMDLRLNTSNAQGTDIGYANTAITWGGTSATALSPGERKAFSLSVNNVGNPPFTYTATVAKGASPAYGFADSALTVQFYAGTVTADTTYPQTDSCSGAALGTEQSIDGTTKSLLTTAQRVEAGSSQAVCVVVGVASGAGNTNQGKVGSLSFAFAATQAVS